MSARTTSSYSPVDWAWAGGLLLGLLVPLAHGIPVVAYRGTRLDPERTIQIMRERGVSVGLFPPTALRMLYSSGKLDPGGGGDAAAALPRHGGGGGRAGAVGLGAERPRRRRQQRVRADRGERAHRPLGVLGAMDRECLGRPYPGHRIAILDELASAHRCGRARSRCAPRSGLHAALLERRRGDGEEDREGGCSPATSATPTSSTRSTSTGAATT